MEKIIELARPFAAQPFCGEDARYSAEYEEIRLARERLLDQLPTGMWTRAQVPGGWPAQMGRCQTFLSTRSKDLQVFGWLTEALWFDRGLSGLVDGIECYVGAMVSLWDHIHPQTEGDDVEMREGPIRWIIERCTTWISSGPASTREQVVLWHRLHLVLDQMMSFLDERLPMAEFSMARLSTLINKHWQAHKGVDVTFLERGQTSLEEREDTGRRTKEREATRETTEDCDLEDRTKPIGGLTARRPVSSRAEAYEHLEHIARFLAATEPHSPTPLILRAVVGWRDRSFSELLEHWPASGPTIYDFLRVLSDTPHTT
ncbi:ImpA family type VI secretion system protein [Caballeronia zhejiangensis]|uniref:type VI secretion system protein TssA n=1 Tax=Caballeronia zhejiangensis TaxID=871203 RepID=UPI00158C0274|nr:type VI secretion system ImpA family N-terminal domain-containing protein [Caballeronia zhejiangensis]